MALSIVAVAVTLGAVNWSREQAPVVCMSRWSACPAADSLRGALERAGVDVTGDTGSALVASEDGNAFYIWSTALSGGSFESDGYRRVGAVEDVEIVGDGVRLSWASSTRRFWVQVGPYGDSSLPELESLRAIVRETQ